MQKERKNFSFRQSFAQQPSRSSPFVRATTIERFPSCRCQTRISKRRGVISESNTVQRQRLSSSKNVTPQCTSHNSQNLLIMRTMRSFSNSTLSLVARPAFSHTINEEQGSSETPYAGTSAGGGMTGTWGEGISESSHAQSPTKLSRRDCL